MKINIKDKGPSTDECDKPAIKMYCFMTVIRVQGWRLVSLIRIDSNFHLRSRNVMSLGLESQAQTQIQIQAQKLDQTQLLSSSTNSTKASDKENL